MAENVMTKPQIGEIYQEADWKNEKHVPVIDCDDIVPKGRDFTVVVTIGKEMPHPNTTEHHIQWVKVFFRPEGEKFAYEISTVNFSSHGASVMGPDTSTVYTEHKAYVTFRTDKPGTIYASEHCNIHGLWDSSKKINVE